MNRHDFAYFLTQYFTKYLPGTCGFSTNTILSYRDTFKQLLIFYKSVLRITPEKLKNEDFNIKTITNFLEYLENQGKAISTRNQRLAAIKAFVNYIIYEDPDHMEQYRQILRLKLKKSPEPIISFLSIDGVSALLQRPNATTKHGYRDMLLLTLLYDSGARVSEIAQVRIGDIRLSSPCTLILHGKGNKERIVPISDKTAQLIKYYLEKEKLENAEYRCRLLFTNPQGSKLTRTGITYILNKYAQEIRKENSTLIPKQLSPHCIRHSKAMHLLQSGVSLIYIRDFLGHSQIKTTEIYAKTDSAWKRKALTNAYPNLITELNETSHSWKNDSDLIEWLDSLC